MYDDRPMRRRCRCIWNDMIWSRKMTIQFLETAPARLLIHLLSIGDSFIHERLKSWVQHFSIFEQICIKWKAGVVNFWLLISGFDFWFLVFSFWLRISAFDFWFLVCGFWFCTSVDVISLPATILWMSSLCLRSLCWCHLFACDRDVNVILCLRSVC